ncbi:MAG: hypothetical protein AAGF95_01300 [Chloroflexota bacterium]
MRFSAEDRQFLHGLAQRYQLSDAAVEALFVAVQQGNGTAAQFNHPDLGGMGQWMASGMIMIGDFSNHRLKATVAQVCNDVAAYLRQQPTASANASSVVNTMFSSSAGWWPEQFGAPNASGSQNEMHYAYFAAPKRLAIRSQHRVALYDTAVHQIQGVSQQQSTAQSLVFRSQLGSVALETLTKVGEYEV